MKHFLKYAGLFCCLLLSGTGSAEAAGSIDSAFASSYSLADLGPAQDTPITYGGLLSDSTRLLLGGSAHSVGASIYSVDVVRTLINGANRITGFTGPANFVSNAEGTTGSGIDGGLLIAPNGTMLFTSYDDNSIGEIKPGSTTPDKRISLDLLPDNTINASVGTFQFIPAGFGVNSGKLLIASYNSNDLYTADLVEDDSGTYDLLNVSDILVNLGSAGPEGIAYVPTNSPLFNNVPTVLITEFTTGSIAAYDVDTNGIPILASRHLLANGFTNPEGATIDQETGDLLFSAEVNSESRIFSVRGFAATSAVVPETGTVTLLTLPVLFMIVYIKRQFGRPRSIAIFLRSIR